MPPNTSTPTADQDSSQDQLEDTRLVQPQNTYPRFLSSTFDFFQQLYYSVSPSRIPSGFTDAETVRSSAIFRGWYPLNTPNSTTVPSSNSAERTGKRVREESPSALCITEQAADSEAFENYDTRPQKRLKETASITRIHEEQAASTARSTEQRNITQFFDNAVEDRGIHDRDEEFGGSDPNARDSDCCEMPENCTSTAPGPMVARVTTHKATSFQGAHDFTIRDNAHITNIGVSNVSNYGPTFDLGIMEGFMEKYVSLNATHDSPVQDPDRKCHPETRLSVLKQIHDWADNPRRESILWLHGPAGVGKSAIAQTIARSSSRENVTATFFFFRSDPSRNDGNKLFTTIAWQLALLIPAIRTHIINSLNDRPDLPRKDIETQFQELIVKPLQAFTSASSQTQLSSLIIIIDGIDECVDEKLQRRFLKSIGNAVNDPDFPLRFLICSRPEVHIEETIDSFQCVPLRLDLAKLDAHHDIEKYFRAEFSRIASEQNLDPTWPGDEKIGACIYKSSGNFVYASTVIKIVDDEYNSAPTQLDIVLGLRPHDGTSLFAELDGLYMEILKRQRDWAFLNDIFSILASYLVQFSQNIENYVTIMNITETELRRKLRGMRSLLKLDHSIDFHHQSFLDFLQDPSRSGQYHISEGAADRRCLDLITNTIVRHVTIILQQPDRHEHHFLLSYDFSYWIMLFGEEVQQALQPLVYIQDKLLSLEKSSWKCLLQCKKCNILSIVRDLLFYRTCCRATSIPQAMKQSLIEQQETIGPLAPFIAPEVEQVVLGNSELDVVLVHLRETLKFPPSAMIINLMCSLLSFDYVETAMKIRSLSDAQLLVDFIDYLVNNEEFLNHHGTTIAHRAARFAMAIHSRVPVLPRSLFSLGNLSQLVIPWVLSTFTSMFLARILDRNYVLRVSYAVGKGGFKTVPDSTNTLEPIGSWRRSKPSSVMMLRVMLEVAKAIRYLDSMDIVYVYAILPLEMCLIYLDSECHVKIFPHVLSRQDLMYYRSESVQHWNISSLEIFLYQLYFDVKYPFDFKGDTIPPTPERPSEPEISDELWQVIQGCFADGPKSRPTIDEIVQEMESWKLD